MSRLAAVCTAGEARTEAMVAAKGKATGEDDNDFDSFVEPAGLILSTVIGMMPKDYHDKARLLREAENLKLPGNPLVRLCMPPCIAQVTCWTSPLKSQPFPAVSCVAVRCVLL